MIKARLSLIGLLIFVFSSIADAQIAKVKREKFSLGGGIKVPYLLSNSAQRNAFRGIFAVGFTYNYEFPNKRMRVGPFTDYHYYQSFMSKSLYPELALRNLQLHLASAGVHFAYDFPIGGSDRWVLTPEVKIGYAGAIFSNLNHNLDTSLHVNNKVNVKYGITASAGLNAFLYTNEYKRTAIGVYVGYSYYGYKFKKADANITNTNSGEFYYFKDNGPSMGIQFGFSFMFKVGGNNKGSKSEYDFDEE